MFVFPLAAFVFRNRAGRERLAHPGDVGIAVGARQVGRRFRFGLRRLLAVMAGVVLFLFHWVLPDNKVVLGQNRSQRIGIGIWVLLAVVVWNVVFDTLLAAAEQRYLETVGQVPPPSLRQVMDPVIRHAAFVATLCTAAWAAAGLIVLSAVQRRARRRASQARNASI